MKKEEGINNTTQYADKRKHTNCENCVNDVEKSLILWRQCTQNVCRFFSCLPVRVYGELAYSMCRAWVFTTNWWTTHTCARTKAQKARAHESTRTQTHLPLERDWLQLCRYTQNWYDNWIYKTEVGIFFQQKWSNLFQRNFTTNNGQI